MENIKLRDYLAGQIISANKLSTFYTGGQRKNIAKEGEKEEWIQLTAEKASEELLREKVEMAYKVADAMIIAREKTEPLHSFTVKEVYLETVISALSDILRILEGDSTDIITGCLIYEKLTINEIINELKRAK